jgi:hypothetical protein
MLTIIKKLNCLIFLYFRKKAKITLIQIWDYHGIVFTVVLNDPGRLISVHNAHCSCFWLGWFNGFYELAILPI